MFLVTVGIYRDVSEIPDLDKNTDCPRYVPRLVLESDQIHVDHLYED